MPAPRRRAVTIKHVAAEAGVSLQTVSRVINNEPNVRPVVQERVRAAVKKLGYVPSIAARRMGGSRSFLILALNDRDRTIESWASREGSVWIDQMLMGGMLKCAEHGYRLLIELVDTHNLHVERELGAAIAALHPDGVILTPPHSENTMITDLLTAEHIPFARIATLPEGPGFVVGMRDADAAMAATRHLLELGHTRIGFLTGSPEYAISAARLEGWRAAMAAAGVADEALVGGGDFSFASGEAGAARVLDLADPATAIVASNDQMALAALRIARERGLEVPRELSIVSFDDTPAARFANPPLTALTHPIAEMTARAAERLIRAKSGEDMDSAPETLPFTLSVRGSTAQRGG